MINAAAPILAGILSKMLLDRKTIKPSVNVRRKMLIIPNTGVHTKNLL